MWKLATRPAACMEAAVDLQPLVSVMKGAMNVLIVALMFKIYVI